MNFVNNNEEEVVVVNQISQNRSPSPEEPVAKKTKAEEEAEDGTQQKIDGFFLKKNKEKKSEPKENLKSEFKLELISQNQQKLEKKIKVAVDVMKSLQECIEIHHAAYEGHDASFVRYSVKKNKDMLEYMGRGLVDFSYVSFPEELTSLQKMYDDLIIRVSTLERKLDTSVCVIRNLNDSIKDLNKNQGLAGIDTTWMVNHMEMETCRRTRKDEDDY